MKTCPSCNAIIKATAKFCSRCGQKLQQDTFVRLNSQKLIDIKFTKERSSLERAVQRFDRIFTDQTLQPISNKEMWENKKAWYSNQKMRFFERNISNELFYTQLKSLNEYLQTTVKIPDDRLGSDSETHITSKFTEEKLSNNLTKKQYDRGIQHCWTCGKILTKGSPYLNFCSKACERDYNPYEIQQKEIPSYVPKPEEVSKNIKLNHMKSEIEYKLKDQELTIPSNHLLSETSQESIEPSIAAEIKLSEDAIDVTAPSELGSEEIQSLFSSIQYQVQELLFEQGDTGPFVRIIPYSGSLKEIKVDFDQSQIIMSGCLKRQNLPIVNLELKINGEPGQPSWEDPWYKITLTGEESIIKRIKLRSEIADRLISLGTAFIKVESEIQGEICILLSCNETQEAVKVAYSLIRDLQSFFEISFY